MRSRHRCMPMLPHSSWIIAAVRMFCAPCECCVQPRAYMVIDRSPLAVEATHSQTFRNLS